MQVYQGMDIGTAKVTTEEMEGIPHYMIDILPPDAFLHMNLKQGQKNILKILLEEARCLL